MERAMDEILSELKDIKTELYYIKKNMANKDQFLTPHEVKLLEESYVNEKNGELITSDELKKELNI